MPASGRQTCGVPRNGPRLNWTFNYILVQRPGPNNALGEVKFMFPNEYAVYLHDTPSRQLFGSPDRPSVCIGIRPAPEICGESADEALATLTRWELLTRPASST